MSHDIVVIGASAGGIDALRQLTASIAENFAGAIFVTVHISPLNPSRLPQILSRAGALPARHAAEGMAIRKGAIYVAPPDRHLLFADGALRLSRGPKESGTRPAIDPMFRSAAEVHGARVIGVLLSGTLDDGSAGLGAIRARGGITVAQDPATAMFADMPANAIKQNVVDHIVPLQQMAALLNRLVAQPSGTGPPPTAELAAENAMTELNMSLLERDKQPGTPTDFTCPDCGGVLRLLSMPGTTPHFRCHVGHAWASASLDAAQVERVEQSLWAALRALDEHGKLLRNMRDHAAREHFGEIAQHFQKRVDEANHNAGVIRDLLMMDSKRR